MKHISEMPWFSSLFARGGKIVSFFHSANKQLALLRRIQKQQYHRHYALILSVLTRWGTQYRFIHSLIRSQAALTLWAIHPDTDYQQSRHIIDIIQDATFWADLNNLERIIEPIHRLQVESESLQAHLGAVLTRWNQIKAHFDHLKNTPTFQARRHVDQIFARRTTTNRRGDVIYKKSIWRTQFHKQILPIHHVAYHLDPLNQAEGLADAEQQASILEFLSQYVIGTDEEKQLARSHFYAFKHRQRPFLANNPCWKDRTDVKLFWNICIANSPHLATLALRVYETAANSIACERAFSVMNFLHTKPRNSTHTTRMDKLIFIYINARVLRHQSEKRKPSKPAPPSDPDSSYKHPKPTDTPLDPPTDPTWLILDADTELDIEDEHLPMEQLNVLQHEDYEDSEEELDIDIEADEGTKEPEKTSDIHQILG